MKLSVVVLPALVAIAYSYPASNAKPEIHETTPSQIHLNDPKLPINQDKTSKPHPVDTFSKMSNCGQPCDISFDCESGGVGHCYSCFRGTCQ
ncbi:hypothetical protein TWF225_004735 [Orbilia oligospora]|nr:hypothetical protein TWF751_010524 [Orbilia oligospora]KAF3186212.1 hypothetical protein TWF225_004735 [Orbilia oligospora]KAF3245903.1 hypothetical protein TWF217_010083 [Orbilia oligospora]KAF3260835.1 hypothetical protein TWF128_003447 [Orbilia oligospora]